MKKDQDAFPSWGNLGAIMNTTLRRAAVAVPLLVCLLLGGCGSSDSDRLVGKWSQSTSEELAKSGLTITFLRAGEFRMATTMKTEVMQMPLNAGGSWVIKGKTLECKPSSVNQAAVTLDDFTWEIKTLTKDKFTFVVKETQLEMTLFRIE